MHTTPRLDKSAARSHSSRARFELVSLVSLAAALVTSACVTGTVAEDPGGFGGGAPVGAGGSHTVIGSGGSTITAGSAPSTGGSFASGGSVANGGSPNNGGSPGSGGSIASGGSPVTTAGAGGAGGSTTGCTVPAWSQSGHYTEGTKVSYMGNVYVALHDNDGLDPTVSTWYWGPSTCGDSTGAGGSTTGAGGSTTVDPNDKKLNVAPGSVSAAYVAPLAKAAARCAFIDAAHLAAQIDQESRWDPNAVSPIGAQGLTQFLPGTWAAFGVDGDGDGKADPFNPYDAIASQGNYMCELVNEMGAGVTWVSLLWAYNAGPNATKAAGGNAPTAEASQYADLILNQLLPKYLP